MKKDRNWIENDGGRNAAGFKAEQSRARGRRWERLGFMSDCVVRAVAIATEIPYAAVYESVNEIAKTERQRKGQSHRRFTERVAFRRWMKSLGWKWTPTMGIGTGCRVHLQSEELPLGRLIVSLSRHMTAVIDGVIQDITNPSRNGTRCVYGYWAKA